jgi:predicted AAA+ superfamily ATPase
MLEAIYANYAQLMASGLPSWQRYLLSKLNSDEKLIGIIGARGVGKTTLLLQLIQQRPNYLKEALYLSLDSLFASDIDLFGLAMQFEREGGKLLVLDEVHHYPNFERTLKTIYDSLTLQVIFSGSSALHLEQSKADLSRRALMYHMVGLSFREYLNLTQHTQFQPYSLEAICHDHQQITHDICQQIRPLAFFKDYLKHGYYPYFLQSTASYSIKLSQTLALAIDLDLPKLFAIEQDKLASLKKMMVMLCQAKPQELNISKMASAIGVSRNSVYSYLNYLEQAELIRGVWGEGKNTAMMAKPEKLYLANTNSFYALCRQADIGTIRETFFVSQLSEQHELRYPNKADFLVDDEWLFEVGGASKTARQISQVQQPAYLAIDDIEHGRGHRIPLWLFGFLY